MNNIRLSLSAVIIFAALFFLPENSHSANPGLHRGIGLVAINTPSGNQINLYEGSHALLVGVSDYTAGWPDLESIPKEMNRLETSLLKKGFSVTKIINPDSTSLKRGFENFIDKYGFESENRLLFFFSGHGYTRKNGSKGYLVPVDAPDPTQDDKGFARKALPMSMIMAWARNIESKHALFLFDSCFSGTIFKTRGLSDKTHPTVRKQSVKPVRQFITAGSAGEEVPAKSVFLPVFIDAIDGEGDLNKDGYVSGMELGLHLQQKIPQHTNQTPQFGKISDYELSQGDFIFIVDGESDEMDLPVATDHSEKNNINKLLVACDNHLQSNRLTTPTNTNAFTCYNKVLKLDASNIKALNGLNAVEQRYKKLAQKAVKVGNLKKARSYITKIRKINPESQIAEELASKVANKQKINRDAKQRAKKLIVPGCTACPPNVKLIGLSNAPTGLEITVDGLGGSSDRIMLRKIRAQKSAMKKAKKQIVAILKGPDFNKSNSEANTIFEAGDLQDLEYFDDGKRVSLVYRVPLIKK
ncbi:MAG: caspase family protein [Magnetococcales bacterium]|nr:caspase family protein [Magnetococcales bacterium]